VDAPITLPQVLRVELQACQSAREYEVSARVGNVKNNDPSLIEPIAVGVD
jgi:hypothetical protein